MRICYLSDAGYVHMQKWARYFADKGNDVHIISTREAELPHVSIHVLSYPVNWRMKYLTGIYYLVKTLKLIRSINPDLVHIQYIFPYMAFAPALFKFWPLVVTPWGTDILVDRWNRKSIKQKLIIKFILQRADAITVISKYFAEATNTYLKCEKDIEIVVFGVDTNVFEPKKNKNSSRIVIGTTKSLKPHYGINFLIKALPAIVNEVPNIEVVIVASGPSEMELKKLVQELNLANTVKFFPAVSHDLIPSYLKDFDLFVIPSITEAFGVAAIEAQAMGIPVVGTRVGGIPEAVIDGETGILVNPGNSVELSEAILKLIKNRDLREKMGRNGREFVLKNFRWEECGKKMEDLYQTVLENSLRSRR